MNFQNFSRFLKFFSNFFFFQTRIILKKKKKISLVWSIHRAKIRTCTPPTRQGVGCCRSDEWGGLFRSPGTQNVPGEGEGLSFWRGDRCSDCQQGSLHFFSRCQRERRLLSFVFQWHPFRRVFQFV